MAFDLLRKTAEYKNKQKKFKLKQKIMTILTSIVVFCTVYALILPAITYDGNARIDGDTAAKIEYTIQHYLWFDDVHRKQAPAGSLPDSEITTSSNEGQLPFINETSNKIESVNDIISPKDILLVKIQWKKNASYNGADAADKGAGSIWDVVTDRKLVKLFDDEETYYRQKPQISYMNRLYNNDVDRNPNYKLKEIWIGRDKSKSESTDANDFTVYKLFNDSGERVVAPDQIRFTNNPRNQHLVGNGPDNPHNPVDGWNYVYTILITNDTVVRFVFDPVEDDDVERDACFYDYDITDGNVYTNKNLSEKNKQPTSYQNTSGNKTLYASTKEQGINSKENYTGSGVKFYFGNDNTGVSADIRNLRWKPHLIGTADNAWNGNLPNKANINIQGNSRSYRIITYGLVKGISNEEYTYKDENGNTVTSFIPVPIFSDGLNVPALFGSDKAIGKSAYIKNEYSLGFKRIGGTYVLDYVKNNKKNTKVESASDLSQFVMTYNHGANADSKQRFWASRFWPMDDTPSYGTDGHDLKFGSTDVNRQYVGFESGGLPTLDVAHKTNGIPGLSGVDHNAYFGMSFSFDFTIQPGFCAPLNYWFYGDDDVWVFVQSLDENGNPTGDAKLIADIGGVHSSTGIYVDLWNCGAVEKVPYGGQAKSYRLTMFYTERGASGSSCYMRITVPLSTYVAPPQERDEALVFEKVLLDDKREEICDDVVLDADGKIILDGSYAKVVQNSKNKEFSFTLQLHDQSGNAFQDMYDYAVYSRKYCPDHTAEDAKPLRSGQIPKEGQEGYEDGSKYRFTLRGGEYIVITNLPDDVWFTVREMEYEPEAGESGYVTQNEVGTHKHIDGQVVEKIDISKRYSLIAGDPAYDINQYNYVRYTNGPAIKTEFETDKNPGNGDTVHVGDEIIYEIEWGNSGNDVSITIEDIIQKGLDFVDAAFGSISDFSRKNGNNTDGFPWANIDTNGETFTNSNGNTITYDSVNKKVTWNITHFGDVKDDTDAEDKTLESGTVTLKVRVNKDAIEKIESGDKITNEATLKFGDRVVITNKTENPVWDPIKTEVTPGENKPVGVGDVITYTVTWKNYLNDNAVVVVRDPLDKNVSFVVGTQKVYIYNADGVAYEMVLPNGAFESKNVSGQTELNWTLPDQEPGAHGYVEFQVKVLDGAIQPGEVVNTAYVKVGNDPELDTNIIKNPVFGVDLPNTGGIGTTLFTFGGIAIMLCSLAAICVIGYRRRIVD